MLWTSLPTETGAFRGLRPRRYELSTWFYTVFINAFHATALVATEDCSEYDFPFNSALMAQI